MKRKIMSSVLFANYVVIISLLVVLRLVKYSQNKCQNDLFWKKKDIPHSPQ